MTSWSSRSSHKLRSPVFSEKLPRRTFAEAGGEVGDFTALTFRRRGAYSTGS